MRQNAESEIINGRNLRGAQGQPPFGKLRAGSRLSRRAKRGARASSRYFLLAFPSMTDVHFVPSCDISNPKLQEVADVIFIVNRPFMVMPPIFSSLVQVHVSPSIVPLESTYSPVLL